MVELRKWFQIFDKYFTIFSKVVSYYRYIINGWNVAWLCESLKSGNQTKWGSALALCDDIIGNDITDSSPFVTLMQQIASR